MKLPEAARRAAAPAFLFALVVYLLWGTGFATDDYVHLEFGLTHRLADNLLPSSYLSVPVLHYTNEMAFLLIGDQPWAYDLLKAIYASLSISFTYSFLSIFCPPRRALVLSLLFVFMPLCDAVVFSLTNYYLLLSFTGYLFAYAMGRDGRFKLAFVAALLASFASYGSPPIAFGLAALAVANGYRKLGAALLGANALYVVYYLTTSLVLHLGTQRLTGGTNVEVLAKNFGLEILTFIDAAFGPSAWTKVFYSIANLGVVGLVVGGVAAVATFGYLAGEKRGTADVHLIATAGVILVGSLGMFALTGLYPQLDFNIGDRVMIYGGFFLICLVATIPMSGWMEAMIVVVLVLATVGISQHWKQWNEEVSRVAVNIADNPRLKSLPTHSVLYVSGHQYSRLGPFCHIDFFTASYVVQTFFRLYAHLDPTVTPVSFNRRLTLRPDGLYDRKFGDVRPIGEAIWLYDSDRNRLESVPRAEIPARLDALPDETRHWIQMLPDGWFKSEVLRIVPRLRYAF